MLVWAAVTAAVALMLPMRLAGALELAPFKDALFAYPGILSRADNGHHLTIDYRELRDINERDEVPERKVRSSYVDLSPRRAQRDALLETAAGPLRYVAVGKKKGGQIITIYLHGQGGNRLQGVNDYTFGGNFNRIKNLMVRNGGLYLSPDVNDFGDAGAAQLSALIQYHRASSPGAPVIIACGSMGGALCWKLADRPEITPMLGGILFLGTMWNDDFRRMEALQRRVPIVMAHGSRDRVFPVEAVEGFYRRVRKAFPGYPIRFIRFETGTHGTPIRMIDWRESINWMLSVQR